MSPSELPRLYVSAADGKYLFSELETVKEKRKRKNQVMKKEKSRAKIRCQRTTWAKQKTEKRKNLQENPLFRWIKAGSQNIFFSSEHLLKIVIFIKKIKTRK